MMQRLLPFSHSKSNHQSTHYFLAICYRKIKVTKRTRLTELIRHLGTSNLFKKDILFSLLVLNLSLISQVVEIFGKKTATWLNTLSAKS